MKKSIIKRISLICVLAMAISAWPGQSVSFAEESASEEADGGTIVIASPEVMPSGDGSGQDQGDVTVSDEAIQQFEFGDGTGAGEATDGALIEEPPAASNDSNGSFVTEGGILYYYDSEGNMAVNRWVTDSGKRYYASKSGAIVTNSFIKLALNEKPEPNAEEGLKNYRRAVQYYVGADGSIQSGIVQAGGKYYFCDPEDDCRVKTNCWVEQGGKRYFASPDGSFYTNRFISFEEGVRYYMGADGSVQSGIVQAGGKYYFCDPANDNRVQLGGWVNYGGKKYFASPDGSFYTDTFITFEPGVKYYCGSDGRILTGVIKVAGKYYYADSAQGGKIAINQWVTADRKYYASEDGSFYTDCILTISSSEKYYLGSDGSVQTGINKYNGEYYYSDSADGGKIAINRWVEAGGNKYFASPTGAFYTNKFIHFGDIHYYMDAYGRVVRTPFEIRGITITPDPTTGAITQAQYDSIYDYSSPLPYSDYVLVDIPSQTLRYYVNGFETLFTYVVTGDKYLHPTPTGTFWLNGGKTQNATLIGEDYETFVNYWMPFIGGAYGMHDATWRSSFGGTIYMGNGSHGCVNMPYEKAKELYFMIPVGTMIIIR